MSRLAMTPRPPTSEKPPKPLVPGPKGVPRHRGIPKGVQNAKVSPLFVFYGAQGLLRSQGGSSHFFCLRGAPRAKAKSQAPGLKGECATQPPVLTSARREGGSVCVLFLPPAPVHITPHPNGISISQKTQVAWFHVAQHRRTQGKLEKPACLRACVPESRRT